ncbi:unnamed protein product [Didymodactylos carnosus]|uniref:ditrans,polycis-polyprenyl diphosphate synthase [(2E,6E)-farnesyldiphosphate specific] n=1 Tax=Didymodactylos carnosus TaxID=1234261 RepID=A0A8S2CL72_9BILA|nr:unnamed protein product [Didymodactylos carnosus]CAF3510776.1 unnamed protein product [Didymodactylos carnosus]
MYNKWQIPQGASDSNQNQNVDWGALATQWVQQREFMQQSPMQMVPPMMSHIIGIPPPSSIQMPMHFNVPPPPMSLVSQQQTTPIHFPPAYAPVPPPPNTPSQQQRPQMQVGPNPLNESISMTNTESQNPSSDQWSKQMMSRHEWNTNWRSSQQQSLPNINSNTVDYPVLPDMSFSTTQPNYHAPPPPPPPPPPSVPQIPANIQREPPTRLQPMNSTDSSVKLNISSTANIPSLMGLPSTFSIPLEQQMTNMSSSSRKRRQIPAWLRDELGRIEREKKFDDDSQSGKEDEDEFEEDTDGSRLQETFNDNDKNEYDDDAGSDRSFKRQVDQDEEKYKSSTPIVDKSRRRISKLRGKSRFELADQSDEEKSTKLDTSKKSYNYTKTNNNRSITENSPPRLTSPSRSSVSEHPASLKALRIIKEKSVVDIDEIVDDPEKLEEFMAKIRRTLTELLLEVTSEEMISIAIEVLNFNIKAQNAPPLIRKSEALSSLIQGMSSDDESEEDEKINKDLKEEQDKEIENNENNKSNTNKLRFNSDNKRSRSKSPSVSSQILTNQKVIEKLTAVSSEQKSSKVDSPKNDTSSTNKKAKKRSKHPSTSSSRSSSQSSGTSSTRHKKRKKRKSTKYSVSPQMKSKHRSPSPKRKSQVDKSIKKKHTERKSDRDRVHRTTRNDKDTSRRTNDYEDNNNNKCTSSSSGRKRLLLLSMFKWFNTSIRTWTNCLLSLRRQYTVTVNINVRDMMVNINNLHFLKKTDTVAIVINESIPEQMLVDTVTNLILFFEHLKILYLIIYDYEGLVKIHKRTIISNVHERFKNESKCNTKPQLLTKIHFCSLTDCSSVLTNVTRKVCAQVKSGQLQVAQIEQNMIDQYYNDISGVSEINLALIIGPIKSALGLYPWQTRLTEFIMIDSYKHLQTPHSLVNIIRQYNSTEQRHGR